MDVLVFLIDYFLFDFSPETEYFLLINKFVEAFNFQIEVLLKGELIIRKIGLTWRLRNLLS